MTIPLGRLSLIASRDLPEWQCGNAFVSNPNAPLLFGLAPDGVYHARHITASAVRSYHTLSPLPVINECRRFTFCGTFPRVTPAGHYPASCFHGARTFLQPKTKRFGQRSSDHLALLRLNGEVDVVNKFSLWKPLMSLNK